MARVKIEAIVDRLDSEFRRALDEAVRYHIPNADCHANVLFSTFKRNLARHCRTWETVPDHLVDT